MTEYIETLTPVSPKWYSHAHVYLTHDGMYNRLMLELSKKAHPSGKPNTGSFASLDGLERAGFTVTPFLREYCASNTDILL